MLGRQALDLNVAELRQDLRLGAVASVATTAPVGFEVGEVVLDDIVDRERPALAGGVMGAADHALPSEGLGLAEGQDGDTVRVREVIGDADSFDEVFLIADIVAQNPLARSRGFAWTAFDAAIAQVQTFLNGAIVGLPAGLETGSGGAGVEVLSRRVRGMRVALILAGVQQTANIRAQPALDK
jgi:hypothetical protein